MPLPNLTNTPRPRAHGFGARINDLLVRLAVGPGREMTIQSAPLEPPKVNTAESAEDIRNDFGALFSRTSFSGGEGLDFAHRTDLPDNASKRYWDSRHIDVRPDRPGRSESIELLKQSQLIESSANTNLALTFDGTALYMAEGTMVRRSTNYAATTPTFANDDPHAGDPAVTVNDLCAVGVNVYAALGASGIHKRPGSTGIWANFSAFAAVKVWEAKDILIASSGTVLSSVALGTGVATTLITLPDGESWSEVADAGAAILASASTGYIYALIDDGSGGLTLGGQSFVGTGVVPCAIAARSGFVFYATYENTGAEVIARWWRSELTANYVLDDPTLIRQFGEPGDGIDRTPCAMSSTNDAVWLGVNESTAAHIWRYDLSQAGRARWWDSGVTGLVHDLLFIGGDPYWTVEASGLYREHPTDYEADGYLIGPLGDLLTASSKAWVGALIDTPAITAGSVELWYTVDPEAILDSTDTAWIRLRSVTSSTLPDTTETRIAGAEGRFISGMLKLSASTNSLSTPSARGFTFRAFPGSGEIIVELPINISDLIERPYHRRLRVRGLGDRLWTELKGMEGSYAELELYSPDDLLRGVIEQVSTPVIGQPRRGAATTITFLRFRGKRVSVGGSSDLTGPVGSFTVGSLPAGGSA